MTFWLEVIKSELLSLTARTLTTHSLSSPLYPHLTESQPYSPAQLTSYFKHPPNTLTLPQKSSVLLCICAFLYATSLTKNALFHHLYLELSFKTQFAWNLWAELSTASVVTSFCTPVLFTQRVSNCECALCAKNMVVNRKRRNPVPAIMVLTWRVQRLWM